MRRKKPPVRKKVPVKRKNTRPPEMDQCGMCGQPVKPGHRCRACGFGR